MEKIVFWVSNIKSRTQFLGYPPVLSAYDEETIFQHPYS